MNEKWHLGDKILRSLHITAMQGTVLLWKLSDWHVFTEWYNAIVDVHGESYWLQVTVAAAEPEHYDNWTYSW